MLYEARRSTNTESQTKIGIYCVSSQSGRAFFADLRTQGFDVYGYVRDSAHAVQFLDIVRQQRGLILERPENKNQEQTHFVPVTEDEMGCDLHKLVWNSDIIIIAEPSHYLYDTISRLKAEGLSEAGTPVALVPPRTFAVPYLWRILGSYHPFICFSTCPYSCKAPAPGIAYIKRRKRNWFASLEGFFHIQSIQMVEEIFPQAVYNHIPATTSIGNIGAVFHPTPYIMKYDEILQAQQEKRPYSYYVEAIARAPEVGAQLEKIDQLRLQIADALGLKTFGLKGKEHEQEWRRLMEKLREREISLYNDVQGLRKARSDALQTLGDVVTSVQHWLDYTYGVVRIEGESIADAVGRTPTYQKMSVPQKRYIEEDVPSSLLPMMKIAERLRLDTLPFQDVMQRYYQIFGVKKCGFWRDLEEFSDQFIIDYLTGKYFEIQD